MRRFGIPLRFVRLAAVALAIVAWLAPDSAAQYEGKWMSTFGNRDSSGLFVLSREIAPDGSLWIAALAMRTDPREPWTQWGSLLLLRYDAQGRLVWAHNQFGSSLFPTLVGCSLKVDSKGFAYAAIYLDRLRMLTKYSPTGVELWNRHLDLDWQEDPALPMAIDAVGRVLIAGNTPHDRPFERDLRVLQYDSDGNLRWQFTHDGPLHGYDYAHHITADAHGRVHVTGVSSRMPDEPGNAILSLALDGDGNLLWSSPFLTSSADVLRPHVTEVQPDGTRTIAVGIHDPDAYWWSQTAFALVRVGPSGERPWTLLEPNVPLNSRECTTLRTAPWGDLIVAGATFKYSSPTTFSGHAKGLVESVSPSGRKLWSHKAVTQSTDTRFEDVLLDEELARVGLVTFEAGGAGSQPLSFTLEFFSSQGTPLTGQRIVLPGAGAIVIPTGLVDASGDLRLIAAASLPLPLQSWVLFVSRYTPQ